MRIVNRVEFLRLSSGVVYSCYHTHGFNGLYVKGDTWTNDWIYTDLIDNVDCDSSNDRDHIIFDALRGAEFKMDLECGSRDGCFQDDDMFAIYDKSDLSKLVLHLKGALDNYPL